MQSELTYGASMETEDDCNHYWMIESPNGPTSVGECKVCGVVREFKNSIQITSWESDGHHVHRPQGLTASSGL
jgi:hypothetical protein